MKYRAIIVEDEPLAAALLAEYILDVSNIELLATFHDAISAKEFVDRESVDLLFLDIHLPQINGLDFLRSLEDPPQVILTTAYHQYALKSYDYGVVDYLLKPIEEDRFLLAISKLKPKERDTILIIKVNKATIRLNLSEVVFMESHRDYMQIHLKNGDTHKTKSTIKNMEDRLPDSFVRIHRSFIIHTLYVRNFSASLCFVQDHKLPIGAKYDKKLRTIGID